MRGARIWILLAIFALLSAAFWWQSGPLSFEMEMRRFLFKEDIAGAVVVIHENDRPEEIIALGRQAGRQEQIRGDTRFPLASLSKIFTAASIRALVVDGRLKLDEKLIDILPDLPYGDVRYGAVTVRHLLQHTAGFEDHGFGDPLFDADGRVAGCQVAINLAARRRLSTSPGQVIRYSNTGYCLLGRILAKITKKNYEESVREWISPTKNIRYLTLGPGKSEENLWTAIYPASSWRALEAAGGWFGNGPAVASLYAADIQKAMINAVPDAPFEEYYYGLGWRIWPQSQGYFLTHFGVLPGMYSFVIGFPDGSVAVGLFNGSPANAEASSRYLANLFAKRLHKKIAIHE
ncbi:serine hydrolase domain-containing protein [Variovorax paradoxus]|uniref:serine hydrolase domain-containing protein n=1 Tax=Variovorax paradoxus TaxID=34073 RepID=UPI003D66281A